MAKMYGCFKPNAFPESRSIVGKCAPPRLAQITVGIIPIVIADSKLRAESDGFVVFSCGSFNLALLVKCKARQHRRVCPFPCKPRTRKKMTVQSTNMRGGVRD